MVELMAGSRKMVSCFAANGVESRSFEIADDEIEDVLQPRVRGWLAELAAAGRLALVWLGPVCASWSIARRSTSGKPGLPAPSLAHENVHHPTNQEICMNDNIKC